ncbi:CD48 antigen-like [Salminus brasiliensis]|uniref:CD48 antigen-like n=1 Tax=Salminus brasiliensis TaxID=930266 RepID=UPI003B839AE0
MELLMFSLSTFFSFTGSSNVSVQAGSSVQLDIQDKTLAFDDLSWMHNKNRVLKYYTDTKVDTQFDPYKGRVEINKETYSLTLKNLQKSDSGLYEAKASGQEDSIVAEYRLSVFDPVEVPVLTQQIRDTCNITLTCGGHGLSITSSCYKDTCEEKTDISPDGIIISLSIRGSVIICNHSNPVSWKMAKINMETFGLCAPEGSAGVSVCLLKTGLYSIILIFMLSAVITVHVRERLIKSS